MAIQIPNPGTGNGASGDNEFVLWSKVKDNFTDQTNAASRLVGKENGRIPLAENVFNLAFSTPAINAQGASFDANNFGLGTTYSVDSRATLNAPPVVLSGLYWCVKTVLLENNSSPLQVANSLTANVQQTRQKYNGNWTAWATTLSTGNTTKDSNGFLKGASPIVKVHADSVALNEDAERQNVTFKKNGIGDYTITTASGLSTDGWYIELPKDMNGNPKVAVTLSEVDGVISLKSYKRIFSMETFTFEPDLDNPLDIPEGRWIDLRLNEIPVEIEYDTQTEV